MNEWACRRVGALTCTQGFRVQLPAGPLAAKPQSSRHERVESRSDDCIDCGPLSTHYSLTIRAEVQMGARLLWEQEDLGSTPRCPT